MTEEQPDTASERNTTSGTSVLLTTIAVGFAIFIGSQLLGGVIASILLPLGAFTASLVPNIADGSVVGRFLTVLIIEIITVLIIWAFLRHNQRPLRFIGLSRPRWRDAGYGILGFIAYVPVYIVIAATITMLVPGLDTAQSQSIGYDDANRMFELLLVFVGLVILPPIAEEILFRGYIYSSLRSKFSYFVAAIVTSLLFAAPHLFTGSSGEPLLWVAFIDTFALSLVLVHLRERTGRLWAPIVLHALKNGVAFVAVFILRLS